MDALQGSLRSLFGLDEFRPSQREVVEDVLAGRDVLCVMPTGAGKSLCYQLPAAMRQGLTIVVSPLIALMEDQVQQLRDEGLAAEMLNSSLPMAEQRRIAGELQRGYEGLLYVAPERFYASGFQPILKTLRPTFLAIDEAHCISQWGHDFRPEYARLGEARRVLGDPPAIALTATATDDVRQDIIRVLGLRDPSIFVTGFDRPNLLYESRQVPNGRKKESQLLALLRQEPGSGIVYCATRKTVDAVAGTLAAALPGRPIIPYHAGLDAAERTANQERFMDAPDAVAVATNAFGMGINKPDLRLVVHYNIPGTLEAYYQEAGRAGRDGLSARCTLLFSYQDRYTHEFFITKMAEGNPDADPAEMQARQQHAMRNLDLVIQYASTHRCRRQMILEYFGEAREVTECQCDFCRRGQDISPKALAHAIPLPVEVVTLVRQILSAVARLHGKFGIGVVAEVLAGSQSERTMRWGFDRLTVFGLLRAHSSKRIVSMLHRMMEAGLARQRDPVGVKFRPVMELTAIGIAVMKAEQPVPATLIDLLPRRSGRTNDGDNRPAKGNGASGATIVRQADKEEPLSPEQSRRFERLRTARMQLATDRQIPPYCICHDSTLRSIARLAPAHLQDLQFVKGMGPRKIGQYGQTLLDAMREDEPVKQTP
jgi:ATP-dependent DNA helicase RecQ